MITGSLKDDSPSLHSKLKRLFQVDGINLIESKYLETCSHFSIQAEKDWREAGVNFNPRPARVLDLMIEAKITDLETLINTLTYLPALVLDRTHSDVTKHLSLNPAGLLALILDDFRHLCYHLEAKKQYAELGKILKLAEAQSSILSTPSYFYLLTKAKTAERQYKKYA